jgi:hypothetical protein
MVAACGASLLEKRVAGAAAAARDTHDLGLRGGRWGRGVTGVGLIPDSGSEDDGGRQNGSKKCSKS